MDEKNKRINSRYCKCFTKVALIHDFSTKQSLRAINLIHDEDL